MTGEVPESVDVVVVGARVAGSVLGAVLADAGLDVVLVERGSFPSPTLSTHFFRGAGLVGVLARLGVLDDVLATGAPPLRSQVMYAGSAEGEVQPPQNPGDVGYALSVRRETLDAIVVARARNAGARVLERTAVTGVLRDGTRVSGVAVGRGEEPSRIRARFVVGADGRHSVVAQNVEPSTQRAEPPVRALYYRYVEGWRAPDGGAPEAAEFSFLGDELAYVFPSDAGLTCLALSIPASAFDAFRSDAAHSLDERFRAHPGFAERVEASRPVGKVLGCGPEENWVRVPFGPGWALVGDAALHQDPWTGLGMDRASRDAEALGEQLVRIFRDGIDEDEALREYHARRDAEALDGFAFTVGAGKDLTRVGAA